MPADSLFFSFFLMTMIIWKKKKSLLAAILPPYRLSSVPSVETQHSHRQLSGCCWWREKKLPTQAQNINKLDTEVVTYAFQTQLELV